MSTPGSDAVADGYERALQEVEQQLSHEREAGCKPMWSDLDEVIRLARKLVEELRKRVVPS